MRISRTSYLPQGGGIVHKIWRAHNKDFLLAAESVKKLYLFFVRYGLEHRSVGGAVKLNAYCLMSNHSHQLISYAANSNALSHFMRIAHGCFGQKFNRIHGRQGPVAYDRPKTPLVQPEPWHQMRVQFYIEANPLRAGMVKNLRLYKFSSYRFYAWGIKDEFSKHLTPPQWYLALGATSALRQSKYRSLFERYLKEISRRIPDFTNTKFIGDVSWVETQRFRMCAPTDAIAIHDG